MEEVVKVESLTKAYGALPAVDHVSLSVKRGTAFGLLGANGAGKSTTIECILGTKRADSGNVSVFAQRAGPCFMERWHSLKRKAAVKTLRTPI